MKPVISIVIPNYDGLRHLEGCLSALRQQAFRNFETILVDNGSRDASISFVQKHFPEVRIVTLAENRGFAAAINAGVAVAEGEFVAWLNNDTEADPGWLEALQSVLDRREYSMWASRVVWFDRPHLLDSAGDGFTRAAVPFKRGHLDPVSNYETQDEVFAPSGSAAVFRRTLIADVGELDERFFLVHEDVDFCLRARLRGHRCLYVPDAIVKHKVNSSIGYLSWAYVFYGQRNLECVYWKNLPWPLLLYCLPAHCVFNLLACGYYVLKGHGLTFMHAKLMSLARVPRLLRQRSDIQSRRVVSTKELWRLMARDWFASKLRIAKNTRRANVADPLNVVEKEARV